MDSFGSFKYKSSWMFHDFLEILLPLRSSASKRQEPMQVLALGLNRCGTDSLRVALEELGYKRCYHGYVCQLESRKDPQLWARLMAKRFSRKPRLGKALPEPIEVQREYFEEILWDCTAVTDAPAAIFGPELIRAYPEAKVIINRRNSIEAWAGSMRRSVVTLANSIGWFLHCLSWFDAESFWVTRVHLWMSHDYYGRDFDRYGKQIYEEHFERIMELVPPERRLEWTVQDGWEPLCEFLDKPVPSSEFPDGNKQEDWEAKVRWNSIRMIRRASRKFLAYSGATVALSIFYFKFLRHRL